MKPTAIQNSYSVRAECPDCEGALTVFDDARQGSEFGHVLVDGNHQFRGKSFSRIHWKILRCAGCGRAGLAKFHDGNIPPEMESFYPRSLPNTPLPDGVPDEIQKELREAELCMSVEANRGASALLRSVLEKTLKTNGYDKGKLVTKIDAAAADGVITDARKRKAHDDIRVLGNEVVHDDWREVTDDQIQAALHYSQRILEDFYDDRHSVEAILIAKKRLIPVVEGPDADRPA